MKIHTIKMYQEFNQSVDKVWDAFADHERFGKILGIKMTRVVDSSDKTNLDGVNSVRRIAAPLMPFEETIRKSDKHDLIEYQISKGTPLHHHYGTIKFKDLGNGRSAVDYTIEIGSKIPLLGGIVAGGLKSQIGGSLKKYATQKRD